MDCELPRVGADDSMVIAAIDQRFLGDVKCLSSFRCHMTSATFSLRPYYSASATSGGGVPWSSREKESQHEDENIDGNGRWRSGSLGRWCYVDRTIGLG